MRCALPHQSDFPRLKAHKESYSLSILNGHRMGRSQARSDDGVPYHPGLVIRRLEKYGGLAVLSLALTVQMEV